MFGVGPSTGAVVVVGVAEVVLKQIPISLRATGHAVRHRPWRIDGGHRPITRLRDVDVRPERGGTTAARTWCPSFEQAVRASAMSSSVIRQCRPTFRPGKTAARSFSISHRSDGAPIRLAASVMEYVRLVVDTENPSDRNDQTLGVSSVRPAEQVSKKR